MDVITPTHNLVAIRDSYSQTWDTSTVSVFPSTLQIRQTSDKPFQSTSTDTSDLLSHLPSASAWNFPLTSCGPNFEVRQNHPVPEIPAYTGPRTNSIKEELGDIEQEILLQRSRKPSLSDISKWIKGERSAPYRPVAPTTAAEKSEVIPGLITSNYKPQSSVHTVSAIRARGRSASLTESVSERMVSLNPLSKSCGFKVSNNSAFKKEDRRKKPAVRLTRSATNIHMIDSLQ
ncbi:hypothetical protein PROFUN_06531 [Planoprotostelium fungivorum]|uniref:Uncharacterized protein n=1 Tax=Planoprotostelium fungivorum TaxID=1890364 RepID=A0A2P6NNZ9_9EUKA|nr:hypothetical protein PROFUN_06531 [Planoprotostelium fungivorum]